MFVDLDGWTKAELAKVIGEASVTEDAGKCVAFISRFFLGLKYKESTLIGNCNKEEVLVIDLSGVDCFTLIDYIEAMRLSDSFNSFLNNLKRVRYRDSTVNYRNRKHFFTDWTAYEPVFVDDLTAQVGHGSLNRTAKTLNQKEDGTKFLPGIESVQRTINYILPENIDQTMLRKMKTGDYAGIYTPAQGLDVSHVGIIIKEDEDTVIFRHASSDREFRKVIDQDFQQYISEKPGLIIFRPRNYRI